MSVRAIDASWRCRGDREADALVASLARDGRIWAVNALLRGARTNAVEERERLPQNVAEFLREQRRLPSFTDPARLARAAQFAEAHLPYLSVSLLAASMPVLFAGAKGAAVLGRTRRLLDDVDRRVNETGRYVLDVLAKDGFSPRGAAVISTLKVRLIHAAVRHEAELATPGEIAINQQDLVATLLAFSLVALRGAERLGVRATPTEREDYFHLWRVVGVVLGIEPSLIPSTLTEAGELFDALTGALVEPSSYGRELTLTLIDGMERHLPRALRDVPRHLVRYLVGDRIADALGVPALKASAARRVVLSAMTRHAPELVTRLSPIFARWIHEAIVSKKLDGSDSDFPMPQ